MLEVGSTPIACSPSCAPLHLVEPIMEDLMHNIYEEYLRLLEQILRERGIVASEAYPSHPGPTANNGWWLQSRMSSSKRRRSSLSLRGVG